MTKPKKVYFSEKKTQNLRKNSSADYTNYVLISQLEINFFVVLTLNRYPNMIPFYCLICNLINITINSFINTKTLNIF